MSALTNREEVTNKNQPKALLTPISVAIAAALAALSPMSHAQIAGSESEIEEILVSASRLPTDLGSVPHSVTLLTAEDIAQQGKITTDLGAMLAAKVPGLVPSSASGSNFSQTLRGRKPAVLIDGVLIGTPLRDGGRELRTITPSAIGAVEVIRGSTALYGNGGAGGVINFLTKTPVEGEFQANVTLGFGGSLTEFEESESYFAEIYASGKPGNFDYVVSASYDDVGLFYDADGDIISSDPGFQGGISDTSIENAFLKLGYDIGDKQRVTISGMTFTSEQDFAYRQDVLDPGDRGLLNPSERKKQVGTEVTQAYLDTLQAGLQAGYDDAAPGLLTAYPGALGTEADTRIQPVITDNLVLMATYDNYKLFGDTSFRATTYYQEVDNRFGWFTFFPEQVDPIVTAENAGLIDSTAAAFLQAINFQVNGAGNDGLFGKHSFFDPGTLAGLAGGSDITDTYQFIRGGQSQTQSEKAGLRADFVTPIKDFLGGGQLLYGIDIAMDETQQTLTDGRVFVPPMDFSSIAYFAQLELDVTEAFTLRTGFRYEDVTVDIADYTSFMTGQTITGAELSYDEPLFNIGGVYSVTDQISVFGGYSQGFIVSDIGRLIRFLDFDFGTGQPTDETDVGVANPDAQIIDNYEIGLRGSHERLSWTFALYQSESEQGSTLNPVTFELVRAPEEVWGYEVIADYAFSESFAMGGTYTFVDGDADFDDDGTYETPLNANRISPAKVTFYADWGFMNGWNIRAQALYSDSDDRFSRVPLEDRGDGELPFDSYLLVDLILTGEIGPGVLNLGLQNALNEDYFTLESQQTLNAFAQAAGPGRSFMLKYTYNF